MASQRRRSEPVFIKPGNNNHLVKIGGPTAAGRGDSVILTSGFLNIQSGNVSLRLINSATSVGFNVTTDTKLAMAISAADGSIFHLPVDSLGFTSGMVISMNSDGKALTNPYLTLGVQRIR
jgi:hypothetical protein